MILLLNNVCNSSEEHRNGDQIYQNRDERRRF